MYRFGNGVATSGWHLNTRRDISRVVPQAGDS